MKTASNELAVLKQSLNFLTEKLAMERSRSQRAEARATVILAVAGILAGFVVHFAGLLNPPCGNDLLIPLALYIGSILLLLKAALFAIRASWALKGNELNAELAFKVQALSEIDAVREELVWKIWEYYQLLRIGNERLFWTHRAQRNIFAAIISFTLLGAAWFFLRQIRTPVHMCITISAIAVMAALVISLDIVSEKFGKLWHSHEAEYPR